MMIYHPQNYDWGPDFQDVDHSNILMMMIIIIEIKITGQMISDWGPAECPPLLAR